MRTLAAATLVSVGLTIGALSTGPLLGTAKAVQVITHCSSRESVEANWTALDDAWLDQHGDAVILVTPSWNKDKVYIDHPIGVFYTGKHWAIYNQDRAPMQKGVCFNIVAFEPGEVLATGGDGITKIRKVREEDGGDRGIASATVTKRDINLIWEQIDEILKSLESLEH
jgi:hypothetical protein